VAAYAMAAVVAARSAVAWASLAADRAWARKVEAAAWLALAAAWAVVAAEAWPVVVASWSMRTWRVGHAEDHMIDGFPSGGRSGE
jgi:hypothetical protein